MNAKDPLIGVHGRGFAVGLLGARRRLAHLGRDPISTRLLVLVATILWLAGSIPVALADRDAPPGVTPDRVWAATGHTVTSLQALDETMKAFMQSNQISAGALAVTRNRRLVYARGFRWAAPGGRKVTPHSRFRIASLSKPITAAAVLRLVEEERLSLDDKVVEIVDLRPAEGGRMEPRLAEVTIRQLLRHIGGWDRKQTFDPMFRDDPIGRVLDVRLPITTDHIIRYMGGRPLDYAPGVEYAYSNYGYCLLGRVIEERSGMPYEDYVLKTILLPLGASATRLGRTAREDRLPDEVIYESDEQSPYGAFRLENMDAHGGWVSSVVDMARFAATFDEPADCPILTSDSIEVMFARPTFPITEDPGANPPFYACGWRVREYDEGMRNTWHTGSLPGTYAIMLRWRTGINCLALFNRRGPNFGRIDPILHRAVHSVTQWPDYDLFAAADTAAKTEAAGHPESGR